MRTCHALQIIYLLVLLDAPEGEQMVLDQSPALQAGDVFFPL